MEGSSTREEEKEEEVAERPVTFSLYHPCYFFEEALRALFKCLGLEFGTKEKKKNSMVKAPLDSEDVPIAQENTESNSHKSSQEVFPTSVEEAADQEYSSTIQNFELVTSIMVVRDGPRRSELSSGSGPQTN